MPITFPKVPLVEPGDAVTSAQFSALADAINARIRSGLGDGAFRLAFWWLSAFRQLRNPDASRNLWPPNAEFFEFYQGLGADVDFPTADPGDPEGINVASLMGLYTYGNKAAGVDSEDDRLTNPEAGGLDVRECATAEEAWQLAKEQRGAIVPSSGRMAAPAFDAALEVFSLVSAGITPHGKAYGGWMPTPTILGGCGDASGSGVETTNYRIQFTRLSDGHVVTYPGTCPANPGDVFRVLDFPLGWYVVKFSGAVDWYSRNEWIEGPYSGGGALKKTHGGHVERIANRFAGEFRGSLEQFAAEVKDGAPWLGNAFDVRRFLTLPYYLAPARALDAGADSLTPVYPTGGGASGVHIAEPGFWFCAALLRASSRAVVTFSNEEGVTVATASTEDGRAVVVPFEAGAKTLTVRVLSGEGVSWELAETLAYRPQVHDLFTVLRIAGARESDGNGTDGSGLTEDGAADLWRAYQAFGCIPRTRAGQFLAGSLATINRNAVFDAARRYSQVVRCIPRANITGYAVENGKSVVWIQPLARGTVDLLDGITDAIAHEAAPGAYSNELVGFLQFKAYNPSGSSLWKPDSYSDYFALSDRCVFATSPLSPNSRTLKTHFNAADPDVANLYLAPEVASGYRYATNLQDAASTLNAAATEPFYRSCRIYEPPVEIESAVRDGAEVKLTFTGRLHHHHALAPASIARDIATWDLGDLTAEAQDYRTDENALREYLAHVADGSRQCDKTGPGNTGASSSITGDPDDPFGTCYPHLWLVQLVPKPYDDGGDRQDPEDVPVTADEFASMETYIRVLCEGNVDGETSREYGCAVHIHSVFDFTLASLCYQAFGRSAFTTLPSLLTDAINPSEVREDGAAGYGPLPTVRLAAETYNQFAAAVNLMTRYRVMLPMSLTVTTYQDSGPTRAVQGTRYADGSGADCGAPITNAGFLWQGDGGSWTPSTFLSGPSSLPSATGERQVVFASNPTYTANCVGSQFSVGNTSREDAYAFEPVDPDALNALPESWRDQISTDGEMLAIVEDTRRVTTWTVTASPTNCDGATWNTGAGSWEITVTETPLETCRLVPSTGRAVAEDLGQVAIFGSKTSGGSLQCDGATYSAGRTLRNITPVDTGALILTVPLA